MTSIFDLRHNFVTSIVYESPRVGSRVTNELIGHWQLGTLLTYHTGFPYTPTAGVDNSLTGVGQDRPNVVGNPYVRYTNRLVWVSPAAFQANGQGKFGNAGYNSLMGPRLFGLDANLSRVFRVTERHQFQLRFEFFNALNHTKFHIPEGSFNSANFGKIQSAADPRILQLALKYSFLGYSPSPAGAPTRPARMPASSPGSSWPPLLLAAAFVAPR